MNSANRHVDRGYSSTHFSYVVLAFIGAMVVDEFVDAVVVFVNRVVKRLVALLAIVVTIALVVLFAVVSVVVVVDKVVDKVVVVVVVVLMNPVVVGNVVVVVEFEALPLIFSNYSREKTKKFRFSASFHFV